MFVMFSEQLSFLLCPTLFSTSVSSHHLLALEKQGLAPEHQWEAGGSPPVTQGQITQEGAAGHRS